MSIVLANLAGYEQGEEDEAASCVSKVPPRKEPEASDTPRSGASPLGPSPSLLSVSDGRRR